MHEVQYISLSASFEKSRRRPSKCIRRKPGSHIKIAKDYRPKTGEDHELLRESV